MNSELFNIYLCSLLAFDGLYDRDMFLLTSVLSTNVNETILLPNVFGTTVSVTYYGGQAPAGHLSTGRRLLSCTQAR